MKAQTQLTKTQLITESTHINLDGRRLVHLQNMASMVGTLTLHAAMCAKLHKQVKETGEGIILEGEVKKEGLVSFLRVKCSGCVEYFYFETDEKIKDPIGTKRYSVNMAAVWGTMASGGGASKLAEILGTMGVPSMNTNTFSKIEQQIGEWWKEQLEQEMLQAAAEEREIAIQDATFHEDVPSITVIVDGGGLLDRINTHIMLSEELPVLSL